MPKNQKGVNHFVVMPIRNKKGEPVYGHANLVKGVNHFVVMPRNKKGEPVYGHANLVKG